MISTTPKARLVAIACLTTAAAAALPATASAATGDFTCTGSHSQRTVTGNVVVPSGQWCQLDGSQVYGKLLVSPGASAYVNGTVVRGTTTVAGTGNLSADGHSVFARTITMDRSNVSDDDADKGGRVSVSGGRVASVQVTGRSGAITALADLALQGGVIVTGSVNADAAKVWLGASDVRGSVTVDGAGDGSVTLAGAKVGKTLTLSQASYVNACASTVRGAFTLADAGGVYLGDNPNPRMSCSGNRFASTVTVDDSRQVVLVGNRVTGKTDGAGNEQVVLRNNSFVGGTSGDFA